jgi:hypothetical protein
VAYAVGVQGEQSQLAFVLKYQDGKLRPCNVNGTETIYTDVPDQVTVPDNNHLTIYES